MPDLFSHTTISYVEREEERVSQFGVAYPLGVERGGYAVPLIMRDGKKYRIEVPDLDQLQPVIYLLRTIQEVEFDTETQLLTCGPERPGEAAPRPSSGLTTAGYAGTPSGRSCK